MDVIVAAAAAVRRLVLLKEYDGSQQHLKACNRVLVIVQAGIAAAEIVQNGLDKQGQQGRSDDILVLFLLWDGIG
jgi:hypothetical protein